MNERGWSRREFLATAGRASAALCVAGSLSNLVTGAEVWAGAESASAASMGEDRLEAVLSELVAEIEKKAPYASALFSEQRGVVVATDRREKTLTRTPRRAGVVFRAHDGRTLHEVATGDVTPEGLRTAARKLKSELKIMNDGFWKMEPGPERSEAVLSPGYTAPEEIELARWRERSDATFEAVNSLDDRVRSATARINSSWEKKIFVNRTRRLRQSLQRSGVGGFLFGVDGKSQGRAFFGRRTQGGLEVTRVTQNDLDDLKREIEDTFRSERIPPGEYTVVSSPAITGLLAHESFGHGVEYDQFIKGRARAAQFLGKRVAPEWVQIWDDPSYPGENGSYFFDDEGWWAEPTHIVKDGVFVQPITDEYSSVVGRMKRTANGRRQEYSHKAYARMSNTFFGLGETPVAEMIASLDNGILLEGFQSGMEDPHGWGIQLTCRLGYEIKSGERTGRVFSPIGVGGYVPDILASITHVGDEFEMGPGTCGKGSKEIVPVATGGPHLLFTARLG